MSTSLVTKSPAERYVDGLNAHEDSLPNFSDTVKNYAVYSVDVLRKYTRIVQTCYGQSSVHAFVDNATGEVLKSSGWKTPAKGVRFATVEDALVAARAAGAHAFSGGYLYHR